MKLKKKFQLNDFKYKYSFKLCFFKNIIKFILMESILWRLLYSLKINLFIILTFIKIKYTFLFDFKVTI